MNFDFSVVFDEAQFAKFVHEKAHARSGRTDHLQGWFMSPGRLKADNLMLRWEERKGPGIEKTPTSEGFGSILVRRSIVGQLGGELDYTWKPEGLSAFISIPMERLSS